MEGQGLADIADPPPARRGRGRGRAEVEVKAKVGVAETDILSLPWGTGTTRP